MNRIRTRTFEWIDEPKNGWRPINTPENFNPGGAVMVAHDTAEHFTNSTNWKGELITFGVIMFTRGINPDMVDIMGQDLAGFSSQHDYEVPVCPERWKNLKLPRVFETRLRLTMGMFRDTATRIFLNEHSNISPDEAAKAIPDIQGWMRLGFAMACRLYGVSIKDEEAVKSKAIEASTSFTHLMQSVDADFYGGDEPVMGDKIEVTWDYANPANHHLRRINGPDHRSKGMDFFSMLIRQLEGEIVKQANTKPKQHEHQH